MTNVITLPFNIPFLSGYTHAETKKPKIRESVGWFVVDGFSDVDKLVNELATNTEFSTYVAKTNKKIIANPNKFEDLSEKYR